MYGLNINPECVKAFESLIDMKQLKKRHNYDEEEKFPSFDALNKAK